MKARKAQRNRKSNFWYAIETVGKGLERNLIRRESVEEKMSILLGLTDKTLMTKSLLQQVRQRRVKIPVFCTEPLTLFKFFVRLENH